MRTSQALKVVGSSLPRVDGEEKVTGKALYTVDIELPGMVYGKIRKSLFLHAQLLQADGGKAERLPGVVAVLTREDLKGLNYYGAAYKDQSIVAVDKVRYVGDPVAAGAGVEGGTA